MANYSYECLICENKFDVKKPMSQSKRPEQCPKCKGATERLPSRTNVGTWYIDPKEMDGEKEAIDAGMYD